MNFERTAVTVRARTNREAADLGFAMARRWAAPVWGSWLLFVVPTIVVLNLIFIDYPVVALLAAWWLKPLFDRIPLTIFSRAFFDAAPSFRQILRRPLDFLLDVYGRMPHKFRGLIAAVTVRRFSPWRTYVMPVDQLEGLPGAARRGRVNVLMRAQMGSAMGLTFLCACCEFGLYIMAYVLIGLIVPEQLDVAWGDMVFADELAPWWAPYLNNLVAAAGMMLIEPFYVAAGFTLYINRRIDLEGWDLELAFRRMGGRLTRIAGVAALMLIGMLPATGLAQTAEEPDYKEVISSILEGPDFQSYETEWVWQRIRSDEPEVEEEEEELVYDNDGSSSGIGRLLANMLLWIIGIAAAIFLVFLITAMIRARGPGVGAEDGAPRVPDTLFGLDLRPESLPDDLVGAARRAWAKDPVQALSLLYRGALSHLVTVGKVEIPQSATEGECIGIVAGQAEPYSGDFAALTRRWQEAAYGHRVPAGPVFARLCDAWERNLTRGPV